METTIFSELPWSGFAGADTQDCVSSCSFSEVHENSIIVTVLDEQGEIYETKTFDLDSKPIKVGTPQKADVLAAQRPNISCTTQEVFTINEFVHISQCAVWEKNGLVADADVSVLRIPLPSNDS